MIALLPLGQIWAKRLELIIFTDGLRGRSSTYLSSRLDDLWINVSSL